MRFSFFKCNISIQTGWAPPPACGPPTVFCAMKPRSQPFQGRDTAPIQNPDHHQTLGSAKGKHASTTRLPTPHLPSPATGVPGDYWRLWEMDKVGAPVFPSYSPIAGASFLLRVSLAQPSCPHPTRCC